MGAVAVLLEKCLAMTALNSSLHAACYIHSANPTSHPALLPTFCKGTVTPKQLG
jgi:hypothetical protein